MNIRVMAPLLCFAATILLQPTTDPALADEGTPLTPKEQLGRNLFFDKNISSPPGQACAVCHGAEVGFTGPDMAVNAGGGVYEGAARGRFGNRKPPSSAYAGDSPVLFHRTTKAKRGWIGGVFWDGWATGKEMGDPLAELAQAHFLNPLEQNMADAKAIVEKVAASEYAPLFEQVWGEGSLDPKDAERSFERIARSIAAYERSHEVGPFSSKYDAYLRGQAQLTAEEKKGLELFDGKANCASCHPSRPESNGARPVFTNYGYENLGLPKNPKNPFYDMPQEYNPKGKDWVDQGLGGYLLERRLPSDVSEEAMGKMKVPTLRNVDKRPSPEFIKSYGHNGCFKSLKEIVHFLNTAAIPGKWPPPETATNINRREIGDLKLSEQEEDAIVAFLATLSDGYK